VINIDTQFVGSLGVPNCVVTDHWRDSVVVVECAGVLDMVTAPHLQDRLTAVEDRNPSALIVDLSGVDFLASHGMNVLVALRRRIPADVGFAVVADGPATSRPLRLIGLAEIINMCQTLDEAYERVGIGSAR
jgi:anti-sigma B factor antagonist